MFWGRTDTERAALAKGYDSELWLAWHPVKLGDGRWCWLDYVWRKWTCDQGAPTCCGWEYGQNHF